MLGRLKEIVIVLVVGVVLFQIAASAITPYLGWIGQTLAMVFIAFILIGFIYLLVRLYQYFFGSGGGSDFM